MDLFRTLMRKVTTTAAVAGAALSASQADAHHGFTGRYNRSAPIYIGGRVERANFGYPHAVLTLTADGTGPVSGLPASAAEFSQGLRGWDGGNSVTVELPPVQLFFNLESRIRVGDRIRLIVLRNCEEPHQLRGQWVAPAAGEPVVRQGRMQTEVNAC
jgi:hypothetical protein